MDIVHKGICCCERKVAILEFRFFSATKQDRVGPLAYSPEALCLNSADSCTHCSNGLDL